ncbi:MAG: bifunctional diguanylate cyclase/phosphodiesterase [Nocardioidaceae bacterium]|nr:bifunctional diguanylate cyclase/phosphodiesterase [Nocardioidaceae bacterium]
MPSIAPSVLLAGLRVVPWLIVAGGLVVQVVMPDAMDHAAGMLASVLSTVALFGALLMMIAVAAVRSRRRRPMLAALTAGVLLWLAGSAVLQGSATIAPVRFPSLSETLFLLSYVGLAAFVLTDTVRRGPRDWIPWLETLVLCGAGISVAGTIVLTPIALAFDRGGLPLLLAVVYPLLDIGLAALVLAQLLLHQRDRSWRTAVLIVGFVVLAAADSSVVLNLASGSYPISPGLNSLWGAAFALMVGAATTPSSTEARVLHVPRRSRTLLAAVASALVVLVVSPLGGLGLVLIPVATVTVAAAGARMAIALREAQGAAEALRLSRTDDLTGLPNRRAVLAELDEGLRSDSPLGFMLLDIDGFKDVNDSVGHATGDALLVLVADRLRDALDSRTSVARLGGDEFAIVVHHQDPLRLIETARSVRDLLAEPHPVDGLQLSVHVSIGISVRLPADTRSTDLLRRADVAMYEAKASRAGALLYDPAQDCFTRDRLRRTEQLRRGIRSGQLEMWYQPQIDAATQEVASVEALVRWRHPTDGLLAPVMFLPDARRYGLMSELSLAVMGMVLDDARAWVDCGFEFRVSLNCAPPELLGGTLLPEFFAMLDRAALPPGTLVVEITEDSFMSDPDRARERMLELRSHHVELAIDDYGTGFSSLSYLRDLPVQELKMDRSFVATMRSDARSRVIVDTTRQMAHAMGLRLVAEGVEDAATAAALVAMNIDLLQGNHMSPPMPAAAVAGWVKTWSGGLSAHPASLPEVQGPPRGQH